MPSRHACVGCCKPCQGLPLCLWADIWRACHCVCPKDLQQLFVLQGLVGAADDDLAGTFKDDLTLTVRDGSPMKLSPAQVKQMSREDLVKIWKVKTGLHLISCKDPCSEATVRAKSGLLMASCTHAVCRFICCFIADRKWRPRAASGWLSLVWLI